MTNKKKIQGPLTAFFCWFLKRQLVENDMDTFSVYLADLSLYDSAQVINRLGEVRREWEYNSLPPIGYILKPLNASKNSTRTHQNQAQIDEFRQDLLDAIESYSPANDDFFEFKPLKLKCWDKKEKKYLDFESEDKMWEFLDPLDQKYREERYKVHSEENRKTFPKPVLDIAKSLGGFKFLKELSPTDLDWKLKDATKKYADELERSFMQIENLDQIASSNDTSHEVDALDIPDVGVLVKGIGEMPK